MKEQYYSAIRIMHHYKDSRHSFCYTFHVLKYIRVHKKLQLDFVKLRMGCSWYHMKEIYKNWDFC